MDDRQHFYRDVGPGPKAGRTSAKLRSLLVCWVTMWNILQKKPSLSVQIVFFGWMTKALPLTVQRPIASTLISLIREYKPEIFLLGASSRGRDLGRFSSFCSLYRFTADLHRRRSVGRDYEY